MDQFLTYKKGNLGPVFNFTAYIYIHICAVALDNWPPFLHLLFSVSYIKEHQKHQPTQDRGYSHNNPSPDPPKQTNQNKKTFCVNWINPGILSDFFSLSISLFLPPPHSFSFSCQSPCLPPSLFPSSSLSLSLSSLSPSLSLSLSLSISLSLSLFFFSFSSVSGTVENCKFCQGFPGLLGQKGPIDAGNLDNFDIFNISRVSSFFLNVKFSPLFRRHFPPNVAQTAVEL